MVVAERHIRGYEHHSKQEGAPVSFRCCEKYVFFADSSVYFYRYGP